MTEANESTGPGAAAIVPEDGTATAQTPLGRIVKWLAVLAFLYALGCAAGVFFGVAYYRSIAHDPPELVQAARAIRLSQIFIVEKLTLVIAFVVLGRALWRYAATLNVAHESAMAVPSAMRSTVESRCWQALLWVGLLYAGWELTSAIAGMP